MRFAAEIGLQAKVLEEIEGLYLKRRELEDRIRNVDWLNKLRIEKGALLDIEAYRADHLCADCKRVREASSETALTVSHDGVARVDRERLLQKIPPEVAGLRYSGCWTHLDRRMEDKPFSRCVTIECSQEEGDALREAAQHCSCRTSSTA